MLCYPYLCTHFCNLQARHANAAPAGWINGFFLTKTLMCRIFEKDVYIHTGYASAARMGEDSQGLRQEQEKNAREFFDLGREGADPLRS
jgi:hypothetical protein